MHREFVVRGYEVDRTGVLPAYAFLRFCEAARWDAFTEEIGRTLSQSAGQQIVVRAQKLEVVSEVRFRDALVVDTWVSRVGRTSFDLAHEVRRGEEVVARALVVVVLVDPAGQLVAGVEGLRALVADRPLPQASLELGRHPRDPFLAPIAVRPSDIDLLQHVNQASYAVYIEDARAQAAHASAYGARTWASASCRRLALEYSRQVHLGDQAKIATWGISDEPGAFAFELWREGEDKPVMRARLEVDRS